MTVTVYYILTILFFNCNCVLINLRNVKMIMEKTVTPFSAMLEAEVKNSGKTDISSKTSTEITALSNTYHSTAETKTSKVMESTNISTGTDDTKISNTMENLCSKLHSGCDKCSGITGNRKKGESYIGRTGPIENKCFFTESNTNMMCMEVSEENNLSTFSSSEVEDETKHLSFSKTESLYDTECVQILDSLPLDSDDIEEEVLDYYESLINM